MAHEALQAIVGTAIVDSSFRQRLLGGTPDVLSRFELTPEEMEAVSGIRCNSIQSFARELHGWIHQDESTGLRG